MNLLTPKSTRGFGPILLYHDQNPVYTRHPQLNITIHMHPLFHSICYAPALFNYFPKTYIHRIF